jgi:ribosomal protein S6--L-glutamate ligase
MLYIVPKPTDTEADNSTAAVIRELTRIGTKYSLLDLDHIDPFSLGIEGDLIWICGIRQDEHQFEILNALSAGNRLVNTPQAIFTCASKVLTTALLLKSGLPSPETLFTASTGIATRFLKKHGRAVIKPVYGYDGKGIRLIESPDELGAPPYYLQEYVPNDRDFRVFVIDGTAVGAIVRTSDALAHNIHQGGTGRPVEVDAQMQDVSSVAARAVGIDYCGVDLLKTDSGYTVLEVNGTPNWHCMAAPIPRLLAGFLAEKENECRHF